MNVKGKKDGMLFILRFCRLLNEINNPLAQPAHAKPNKRYRQSG